MGDGGIPPVEESDSSVFDEHIAVMEVAIVQRFGKPKRGQIRANLLEARSQVFELVQFVESQTFFLTDHQTGFICKPCCIQGREFGKTVVWNPQRENFVNLFSKSDLYISIA